MSLTITEALAEIKTIGKRIQKKREFMLSNLARQDGVKDPMEKDGGSPAVLEKEQQAVTDLENRVVALRRGIQRANDTTIVTIGDKSHSIANWLTWRRDVAPARKDFLAKMRSTVAGIRENAKRQGVNMIPPGGTATQATDITLHISELSLANEIEGMETVLGQLDGLLSLKNATVTIVED